MNGFSLGKPILCSLLFAFLSGCGGLGPLPQTLSQIEIPESEQTLTTALKEDQWMPRQEWTIWSAAGGIAEGGEPERVTRWTHPTLKLIRDNFNRSHVPPKTIPSSTDSALTSSPQVPSLDWSSLIERDDLVGWNALICFARYRPLEAADYLPLLVEMVAEPLNYTTEITNQAGEINSNSNRTSDNFRAAAAEACGLILQSSNAASPSESLQLVMNLAERPNLSRDVQAELFRALARILPPREIPRLPEILKPDDLRNSEEPPPAIELRLAALDACLYYALLNSRSTSHNRDQDVWPPNLFNLRNDPDPRLRMKIGQLAAIIRHPVASGLLEEQLLDSDPQVRLEAIVSLGRLGTPAAREELRRQILKSEEMTRMAAIKGFAFFDSSELRNSVNDPSPHVREELAVQLSGFQDRQSALLLKLLLVDSNYQVQLKVIRGLVYWPDRFAVPLLVYALQESSTATRQAALTSLETRRGYPLIFPVHAPREERLREAEKIARLWPSLTSLEGEGLAVAAPVEAKTEHLRIADLLRDLRTLSELDPQDPRGADLQKQFMNLKPSDVSWLETYLSEAPNSQRTWILNEVLPQLNRSHACLAEMEHSNVEIRRRGAEHLVAESLAQPMNPLQLSRLERILTHEQDAQVWRFSMTAIQQEHSPQGIRIAQMAVQHAWPDIRILGCRMLERLGDSEQAIWLIPLFTDENLQVRMAAVDAAAKSSNPIVIEGVPADGRPGVRSLLTAENLQLRVKVCACLAQFGDAPGSLELLRLSRDPDWTIRYQAIESMGRSGQTRFVETLTQLGWAEKHPSVQRALLQALEQLVPPVQRPQELNASLTPDRQIEVWVNWSNRKQPPR